MESWALPGQPPPQIHQPRSPSLVAFTEGLVAVEDVLTPSRVGQHAAIGMAMERSAATRLRQAPKQPHAVDAVATQRKSEKRTAFCCGNAAKARKMTAFRCELTGPGAGAGAGAGGGGGK